MQQQQQDAFKEKWVCLEPVFTTILRTDKHGVDGTQWMQSYTFATTHRRHHHF